MRWSPIVKSGKNRHRLAETDLQFLQSRLTHNDSQETHLLKLVADPVSADILLDSEVLYRELLDSPLNLHLSAFLYFYILLRKALIEVGIDDRDLTDYVAAVLAEQVTSRGKRGPNAVEADFTYGIDLLKALNSTEGYKRFAVCVVAGEQFLFLTGLFPEFLMRREQKWGAPGLNYYEEVGRHSFRMARDHPLAQEFDMQSVYDSLTSGFKKTRMVLNDMAQRVMTLD